MKIKLIKMIDFTYEIKDGAIFCYQCLTSKYYIIIYTNIYFYRKYIYPISFFLFFDTK